LNPRRTFRPVRDFQSRSLDRSDTSPSDRQGTTPGVRSCTATFSYQNRHTSSTAGRRRHGFVTRRQAESTARASMQDLTPGWSEAEKEGFEPSRQGFSPPNALAGRRLQPLGHFSAGSQNTASPLEARPPRELLRSRTRGPRASEIPTGLLCAQPRRGGRAVECGGLENRSGRFRPARVQIPPPPLGSAETGLSKGLGASAGCPKLGALSAPEPRRPPESPRDRRHWRAPGSASVSLPTASSRGRPRQARSDRSRGVGSRRCPGRRSTGR
jgi:hypothetical protein